MAPVESTHLEPKPKPASALAVRNVLFPIDFSPTAESALPYAMAICRRFGATLHLVHVFSDTGLLLMTGGVDYVSMGTIYEDAQNEARDKLDEIAAHLDGIPHRSYVRHGMVWKSLETIIEQNGIDLIVAGTHGRSGLGKLLLGSVAEGILRHAACPVLTVGPNVSGHAKLPAFRNQASNLAPVELDLRQLLFATDFSSSAPRMAQEAAWLAEEFHARLTLMHVAEDHTHISGNPDRIEEILHRLRELIPINAELQYIPETLLEFGHAPERVLKAAEEREADMIILGARAYADVASTHLPSTAHDVIARAHCPVLTVRE